MDTAQVSGSIYRCQPSTRAIEGCGISTWGRRPWVLTESVGRERSAIRRDRSAIRRDRSGAGTDPGATPLERSSLVLAQTAPYPRVLTAVQGPLQARLGDLALRADLLRLIDLEQGRAGVPDREEQLRVDVTTGGVIAPVHAVRSSSRTNEPSR